MTDGVGSATTRSVSVEQMYNGTAWAPLGLPLALVGWFGHQLVSPAGSLVSH